MYDYGQHPPWWMFYNPSGTIPRPEKIKQKSLRRMIREAEETKTFLEELAKKKEEKKDKPKEKTFSFLEMFILTLALSQIMAPLSWLVWSNLWRAAGLH